MDNKLIFLNSPTYLSGGGGLESSAEDYLQFAQMLANRGELNGKRLLRPNTVDLMSSVFVPDTLPGRAKGRGRQGSRAACEQPLQRIRLARRIRDALLGRS